jgi:hypothetical protein
MAEYGIPVQFDYNGQKRMAMMGPFQHSTEREFALTVNRKAIDDCLDLDQLKPVTKNSARGLVVFANCFSNPHAGKHSIATSNGSKR